MSVGDLDRRARGRDELGPTIEEVDGPTGTSPSHPVGLERDATTRDGVLLHVRPIRPDDGTRLMEFHQNLSPQSVYRRFFYMHPRLSSREVERFTHVDYVNRLALIAEDHGRLVAVGRYERLPDTADAEVAFVVADGYQHRGIGTTLLEQLADAAMQHGIRSFVAKTLAENQDMLGVFMDSGFQVTSSREYGTVNVRFPIEPHVASRSAQAE